MDSVAGSPRYYQANLTEEDRESISRLQDTKCKHTFVKEERRSSDGLLLPPKFSRSPSSTSGDRKRRRHTSRPCDEQYSYPSPPNSTSTRHPHGNQWHQSTVDQSLGGIDPFDTLQFSQYGISQDRMTDMALHHWTNVFQKTRMPLTPRPLWLRICLSDPVLLSVTICAATSHFYYFRGMRVPTATYIKQKVRAIRAINETMKMPNSIPNDYTITAVAIMTILECLAGEPTAWAIHKQGLDKMIQSRGGIQNLDLEGAAPRTVSWADVSCAILLRTPPSFKPALYLVDEDLLPTPPPTTLPQRLYPLTYSSGFAQTLSDLYSRLHQLALFLTTASTSAFDDILFSDKLDILQRHIIDIMHSSSLASAPDVAFLTAFLNACLIYIYGELRQVSPYTRLCVVLASRIASGLEMVDLESLLLQRNSVGDLVVWTLVVGRSVAEGRDGIWFRRRIIEVEDAAGKQGGIPAVVRGMCYFALAENIGREAAII